MLTSHWQLKNNSTFPVRVVIISQNGSDDFQMDAGEAFEVDLQDGVKALLAWDTNTNDVVQLLAIKVTKAALFRVFIDQSPQLHALLLANSGSQISTGPVPVTYEGDPFPSDPPAPATGKVPIEKNAFYRSDP
jgi:hypothetical protein